MSVQQRLNGFKRTKYKTIDFHGHAFEVYLPTRLELQGLTHKCQSPPADLVEEHFARLKDSLMRTGTLGDPNVEIKDDDILIEGRSMRQTARWLASRQLNEVAMIGLVGFAEGEDVFALSYDELSASLSDKEIEDLVKAVEAVVKPRYEATEKN